MNILMLCFNQVGQGTYLRAYQFARCLVQAGHHVTILATSRNRRFRLAAHTAEGIQVVESPDLFSGPLRSGWDPYNILARISWIKGQSIDIVHAFEARPTAIFPARRLQATGVPMVLDWADWFGRGGSVEERPNPLIRRALRPVETYFEERFRRSADANTVICRTLEERARSLGVNEKKLTLIPNGFDIPGWKRCGIQDARAQLGLPQEAYIVGYIGALFQADATLMHAAFNALHARLPTARLLHIGRSNYLLPAHAGLITTGPVDEDKLELHLAACDICWLPLADTNANRGRLPYKFSVMLSAGKALAATDVGDIPGYLRDHRVGLVCPPTAGGLAEAALQLHDEPALREQFADAALRLSQDPDHTWEARTAQLRHVYAQFG